MIKCIKTSFFTLPFCTNFAIMFYVYKLIQKGEEIMNENKEFKPYIPADKIVPEFVISTEPTDGGIYRGQRGRMEIRVDVKGVSCHGSAPERGDNAI